MVTSVTVAALVAITAIAIAAVGVATWRARAARRGGDQTHVERAARARTMEGDSRLADDVAHDLDDLLTAITGHAELLIASLDPSGASIRDAHAIRRAALSAARLTRPLPTPSRGHRAPTDAIDVSTVAARTAASLQPPLGPTIQLDSVAGVGTTSTIDLPATPEPAAATDVARETRLTAPVLVVEDEPGMREFIRLVLVRAGHKVVTVADPRAALAALSRQPAIPLMLVDVVMPVMDGYEVVAEARKISPSVHVVFISAFAPDPTRQPIGDGFLAKPFTSELLTGMVDKALSY